MGASNHQMNPTKCMLRAKCRQQCIALLRVGGGGALAHTKCESSPPYTRRVVYDDGARPPNDAINNERYVMTSHATWAGARALAYVCDTSSYRCAGVCMRNTNAPNLPPPSNPPPSLSQKKCKQNRVWCDWLRDG